jgi:hypothetical protein
MLILDFLRIFLSVLMLILSTFYFLQRKKENSEQGIKTEKGLLSFLDPCVILNLTILIIYSLCISLKLKKLKQSILSVDNSGSYISLPKEQYFSTADSYELAIAFETIIMLLLFCQFIIYVYTFKRFKIFVDFMLMCLSRILIIFFLIIMIIVSYSILANNIWGQYYQQYRDFRNSFVYSLLFSIGHFQSEIFDNRHTIWNVLFTLIFFVVIIYFFHSLIPAVFMEMYRMNSLNNGHSYETRLLNTTEEETDDKKKKKKVKNTQENIK